MQRKPKRRYRKEPSFVGATPVTNGSSGGLKNYGDEGSLFGQAYSTHLWVYVCAKKIASNLAAVPILPYVQNAKGDWVVDTKHELFPLLDQPNPYFSGYMMRQYLALSMVLYGKAFLFAERLGTKQIKELWPLLPDRVKPVSSPTKMIDHYVYQVNGRDVILPYDQVFDFREPNPRSFTEGQGNLEAAKMVVASDLFAQIWNKAFFKNSARPDGSLETDQTLTDEVRASVVQSWKEMHQGVGNNGNTALLEAGLKYKQISTSPKDMDFVNLRKDNRVEVCAVFGVPPSVAGLLEFANYSNMQEQYRGFWTDTLIPLGTGICEQLTLRARQITFRPQTIFQQDTSKVAALQPNLKEQAETFQIFVNGGVPPNQVIEALDLPFEEYDGWNQSRQPAAVPAPGDNVDQPNPADQGKAFAVACPKCKNLFDWSVKSPACSCGAILDKEGRETSKQVDPAAKELARNYLWKDFEEKGRNHEGEMRSAMKIFFSGQARRVIAAVKENSDQILANKGVAPAEPTFWDRVKRMVGIAPHEKDVRSAVSVIFNLEKEKEVMARAARKPIKGTYLDFAVRATRNAKPGLDFDLSDPAAEAWIENKTLKLAREANKHTQERITQAVVDALDDAVTLGISDGETIAQIVDRLNEIYDFAQKGRAERIARTEVIAAANAGTQDGMEKAGVEQKEWLSSRDAAVRETHDKLDGTKVGIKEPFVSESGATLQFPGDPGAPADEVINCRCTLIAVVK